MEFLDIKTLSERTNIPPRQIRYVFDHDLVPQSLLMEDQPMVGRARVFDQVNAVYIACAAFLLTIGCRRDAVQEIMKAFAKPLRPKRGHLNLPEFRHVVTFNQAARVQYADGQYVRWIINGEAGPWFDPKNRRPLTGEIHPKAVIELDVGEIRNVVTRGGISTKHA